jgi:hypothetical protein
MSRGSFYRREEAVEIRLSAGASRVGRGVLAGHGSAARRPWAAERKRVVGIGTQDGFGLGRCSVSGRFVAGRFSNAERFASGPDQTRPDKFLGCSGASRTTCGWDGGGAAGACRPLA